MKNTICIVLAVVLLIAFVAFVRYTSDSETAVVQGNDTTLGTLQNLLIEHLKRTGNELKPGTEDYYAYICNQLFDQTDKALLEHPHYDLIHAYMVEYKNAYANHMQSGKWSEWPGAEFLSRTISGIAEENRAS